MPEYLINTKFCRFTQKSIHTSTTHNEPLAEPSLEIQGNEPSFPFTQDEPLNGPNSNTHIQPAKPTAVFKPLSLSFSIQISTSSSHSTIIYIYIIVIIPEVKFQTGLIFPDSNI